MVKILKFIYVMIIFLSLFLVATNVNGNQFLIFLTFLSYSVHNIIYYFNNIFLFSFFITAINKCSQDSHCPKDMCKKPSKPRCVVSPKLPLSSKSGVCTCV